MKNFKKPFLGLLTTALIIMFVHPSFVFGQTTVIGEINQNTVWDLSGSPYIVEETLIIEENDTLWIEPDVEVRISGSKSILVRGHLSVDSATITSVNERWRYISNRDGGSMRIDNSTIENGGGVTEYSAALRCYDNCSITNSEIINHNIGVRLYGNSTIIGNTFDSHDKTPIDVLPGSNLIGSTNLPTIENNNFGDGNTYNAIGLRFALYDNNDAPVADSLFNFGIPYVLFEETTIGFDDSLTIMPGAIIKIIDGDGFTISTGAHFKAVGEEDNPIVFTSIKDDNVGTPGDTNTDGNGSVPEYDDWNGLYINNNDDVEFDFVEIRYGSDSRNQSSGIVIDNSNIAVSNSQISNTRRGITVLGNSQPTIQNNRFLNTVGPPIALSMSANPVMSDNDVSDAGLRAIGLVPETVTFDGTIRQRSLGGFENITYSMLGDITIAESATINIEPGIVIKAGSNDALFVEGALNASGNETEGPITFTSIKDDNVGNPVDTNNDGNGSAPEAGDWDYILFRSNTNNQASKIEDAEIKFAESGIVMHSANVPVYNTTISNSGFWGISLDGNSSPIIDSVTIESSNDGPIAVSTLADPVFSNIQFNNNGNSGLFIIESRSTLRNIGFLESSNLITNDATLAKRTVAGIDGIPYIFGSNMVVIGENTTLTIEPGVILKFNRSSKIRVNGALNAEGTEEERIIFTSIKDDSMGGDTNNDGNESDPSKDDWAGILFNDSSIETENLLKFATIRFAETGNRETGIYRREERAITFQNSSAVFDNVIIEQMGLDAISIRGTSNPVIKNSQFLNVSGYPIVMDMFSNPMFEDNLISNTRRAIGIWGETWSNDATVPLRSFSGYDNITYVLHQGDITVGSGTTITIPEGIVFKSTRPSFTIEGTLKVTGTDSNPVVFTHLEDDEFGTPRDTKNNGDRSGAIGLFSDSWITFRGGSDDDNSVIDYAIFRYREQSGQLRDYSGIFLENASPTIKNSRFEFNNNGIYLKGVSEPILENNVFNDTGFPIAGSILSYPYEVSGNQIVGSTYRAIGIEDETLVQDFTLPRRNFADIEGIPYYFKGRYIVGTSAVLTIDPGVILKFRQSGSLRINRGLIAEGTADSMIVFTAIEDDFYGGNTNSDSTETFPTDQRRQWHGIQFNGESLPEFSRIDHSVVRFASAGWDDDNEEFAGINVINASPTITNSILQKNRYGIKVAGSSNPIINNNDIFDNLEYGVWNVDQTFTIDATNNWWGNNSGPTADGNPEGTGDRVSEGVSYLPFEGGGAANPQLGDVALNGRIMAYDASVVLKSQVGLETLSEAQRRSADVSGDGTVSAMDASYILQFVVNLIQNFPADMRAKGKTPEPLAEVSDIGLSIGSPDLREGGVTAIPVYMETIENLLSFSIQMDGMHEGYQFIGAEKGELLTDASLQANAVGSVIKSAMASTELIRGSGKVMTLLFEPTDPDQDEGLELNPVQFIANETDMTGLVTSADETDPQKPEEFALQQNYPNPFNPSTTIRFDLPARADVTLEVYNMIGRRVAQLAGGDSYSAGSHTLTFDASGLASGMYIYRIQATNTDAGNSGFLQTRKMMLIK